MSTTHKVTARITCGQERIWCTCGAGLPVVRTGNITDDITEGIRRHLAAADPDCEDARLLEMRKGVRDAFRRLGLEPGSHLSNKDLAAICREMATRTRGGKP